MIRRSSWAHSSYNLVSEEAFPVLGEFTRTSILGHSRIRKLTGSIQWRHLSYRTYRDELGDVEKTSAATYGPDLHPLSSLSAPEDPLVRESHRCPGRRIRLQPHRLHPRLHTSRRVTRRDGSGSCGCLHRNEADTRRGVCRVQGEDTGGGERRETRRPGSGGGHRRNVAAVRCASRHFSA